MTEPMRTVVSSAMGPLGSPRMPVKPTAAAFAVHVFTACGAGCALFALLAAVAAHWSVMFVWLGLAFAIDGIDGTLARWLRVVEILPRWSGEVLDLVVDVLNYVFVPAYALVAGGLLPQPVAVPLGLVVVITGALYFADRRMKTADNYFRGFPAIWNVAVFYLFLLKLPGSIAAAIVVALAVLTFAPVHFIHPVRVARLRMLTMAALVLWALLALVAVGRNLEPSAWITAILCVLAIYFVGIGFLRRRHP
jgi:phosphatidylcholine synthase